MTIKNLIELFLSGSKEGSTCAKSMPGNLKIRGDKLFHYDTVIAERTDSGSFIINLSQHSIRTGNVQKQLKQALLGQEYVIVKKVPRNYSGSLKFFSK